MLIIDPRFRLFSVFFFCSNWCYILYCITLIIKDLILSKKKSVHKNDKYDWVKIRKWYISQPVKPTYNLLEKKFKIHRHSFFNKIKTYNWEEDRVKVQLKRATKTLDVVEKPVVNEDVNNDYIPETLYDFNDSKSEVQEIIQSITTPSDEIVMQSKLYKLWFESKINRAELANISLKNGLLAFKNHFKKERSKAKSEVGYVIKAFDLNESKKISEILRNSDAVLNNLFGENKVNLNIESEKEFDDSHVVKLLDSLVGKIGNNGDNGN